MNELVKTIGKEVAEPIKQRLSSPLLASFFISWCIVNFELFLVVFGKGKYEDKLGFIHCTLYGKGLYSSPWHFLYLPLISALIYTFVFPFIKGFVEIFLEFVENIKERGVLFVKNRKPMDIGDQVSFLEKNAKSLKEARESWAAVSNRYMELSRESIATASYYKKMMCQATCRQVIAECGGSRNDAILLFDVTFNSSPCVANELVDRFAFLAKHRYFKQWVRFVELMEMRGLESSYQSHRVSKDEIVSYCNGLTGDDIADGGEAFVFTLISLGLITEPIDISTWIVSFNYASVFRGVIPEIGRNEQ